MRAVLVVVLLGSGCAPTAMPLSANHPGASTGPAGRLAGPPPALRPDAASRADAAPTAELPKEEHHHHESAPETKQQAGDKP
jgi:hypothetical protein